MAEQDWQVSDISLEEFFKQIRKNIDETEIAWKNDPAIANEKQWYGDWEEQFLMRTPPRYLDL